MQKAAAVQPRALGGGRSHGTSTERADQRRSCSISLSESSTQFLHMPNLA